jgi:hypothetical protein
VDPGKDRDLEKATGKDSEREAVPAFVLVAVLPDLEAGFVPAVVMGRAAGDVPAVESVPAVGAERLHLRGEEESVDEDFPGCRKETEA